MSRFTSFWATQACTIPGEMCKSHAQRFDGMQCSMCCTQAQGSMQKWGGNVVCLKCPCVSHNQKGLTCTAKGCNAFIFKWKDWKEQGNVIHEWFCGRHWNLAYDGCMNCQKSGSTCIKGVPMMSYRGGCAYPIMQAQTNAIILVDAPTRPMTMLEFVQSMTEGGGQWENLVVMRDAKIKVEMLQPWEAHQYSLSDNFLQAKHKDTNIPTMMEPFSSPVAWFWWTSVPHPLEPTQKGFGRGRRRWV